MYWVQLFDRPVPDGETAPCTIIMGAEAGADGEGNGGPDGNLRKVLKEMIRFYCCDPDRKYFVQIWDETKQAWYKPWNFTWFDPPADGLIPVENVSQVGPLRL